MESATLLKAAELARRLNVGKSTIYKLASQDKIPVVRIGDAGVRFELDAVMDALRKVQ